MLRISPLKHPSTTDGIAPIHPPTVRQNKPPNRRENVLPICPPTTDKSSPIHPPTVRQNRPPIDTKMHSHYIPQWSDKINRRSTRKCAPTMPADDRQIAPKHCLTVRQKAQFNPRSARKYPRNMHPNARQNRPETFPDGPTKCSQTPPDNCDNQPKTFPNKGNM